ncbi:MAG: hypothetical protein IT548_00070 [Alphaproteobacteria bacterium]|nr:hypothetical protein [Alphaproteobacteria bacterium]
MKITTPMMALVGALALSAPLSANASVPAASASGAHHLAAAKDDKAKEHRRVQAENRKVQAENRRQRQEAENRRIHAENRDQLRENRRIQAENREQLRDNRRIERRNDAIERQNDRRQAAVRRADLNDYRAHMRERQRERLVRYYRNAYERHSCPPGLRREYGGCYPAGWDRRRDWSIGYALPSNVVYYDLPVAMYDVIDPAPYGYRYVQVGNDILLIDLTTRIIVDSFSIY